MNLSKFSIKKKSKSIATISDLQSKIKTRLNYNISNKPNKKTL